MGVRHRILVAGEHLAGHQPGEVRHVDHQGGIHIVGDVPHRREVDPPRIGRVAATMISGRKSRATAAIAS
jgi:hypothetical protein